MENNKIDDIIKEKLLQYEDTTPVESGWEQFALRANASKLFMSKKMFIASIAANALLLISVGVLTYQYFSLQNENQILAAEDKKLLQTDAPHSITTQKPIMETNNPITHAETQISQHNNTDVQKNPIPIRYSSPQEKNIIPKNTLQNNQPNPYTAEENRKEEKKIEEISIEKPQNNKDRTLDLIPHKPFTVETTPLYQIHIITQKNIPLPKKIEQKENKKYSLQDFKDLFVVRKQNFARGVTHEFGLSAVANGSITNDDGSGLGGGAGIKYMMWFHPFMFLNTEILYNTIQIKYDNRFAIKKRYDTYFDESNNQISIPDRLDISYQTLQFPISLGYHLPLTEKYSLRTIAGINIICNLSQKSTFAITKYIPSKKTNPMDDSEDTERLGNIETSNQEINNTAFDYLATTFRIEVGISKKNTSSNRFLSRINWNLTAYYETPLQHNNYNIQTFGLKTSINIVK
ncbi:MAG: hypothetical protein QM536_07760 [Chitinophagaceae bacterium]|nr:hypothetical protein [Chitinophagaceae bacterium]